MSRLVPAWYSSYCGPLLRHDGPQALLLRCRRGAGLDRDHLVPHLDLHVRMGDQVLVPARMVRRPTLRRHEEVVVAVAPVDERELRGLPGFPTGRVQDQAVCAVPVVTHLAAGRFVLADVLVTEEAEVRHGATVTRSEGIGDPLGNVRGPEPRCVRPVTSTGPTRDDRRALRTRRASRILNAGAGAEQRVRASPTRSRAASPPRCSRARGASDRTARRTSPPRRSRTTRTWDTWQGTAVPRRGARRSRSRPRMPERTSPAPPRARPRRRPRTRSGTFGRRSRTPARRSWGRPRDVRRRRPSRGTGPAVPRSRSPGHTRRPARRPRACRCRRSRRRRCPAAGSRVRTRSADTRTGRRAPAAPRPPAAHSRSRRSSRRSRRRAGTARGRPRERPCRCHRCRRRRRSAAGNSQNSPSGHGRPTIVPHSAPQGPRWATFTPAAAASHALP